MLDRSGAVLQSPIGRQFADRVLLVGGGVPARTTGLADPPRGNTMTPVQVRMARAALDLTTDELSRAAGLSLQDLEQLQKGGHEGAASAKLRMTFEGAGITFLDRDGVRFDERQGSAGIVPLEEMNSYNDE